MKIIKRILSIETAVEVILVIFAVANFSIISDYFLHSGLNEITSYSVGALLGGILITVALMLSKVEKDHKDFKVFVVVTAIVAIFAAILQVLAYHTITHDWITSIIKGAGFPLIEVLVAYSASLFTSYIKSKEEEILEEEKRRKLIEEKSEFEDKTRKMRNEGLEKVVRAVAKSFDNLDVDAITEEVAPFLNKVAVGQAKGIVQQLDPTVAINDSDAIAPVVAIEQLQMLPELLLQITELQAKVAHYEKENAHLELQIATQPLVQTEVANNLVQNQDETAQVDSQKTNSLQKISEHLVQKYDGVATVDLDVAQIANELQIHRTTVTRNIEKLQKQNKLNGHVNAQLLR